VREIFDAALEVPPSERAALLDRECAGKPAVRAEVESLLGHDTRLEADFLQPMQQFDLPMFLNGPPSDVASFPPKEPSLLPDPHQLVGRTIGKYSIRGLIGRGGMSVVYLAQQHGPQRLVALKVMTPSLLSPAAWRRFEYESDLLAGLRHPNIAQVYEAGTFTPSEISNLPVASAVSADGVAPPVASAVSADGVSSTHEVSEISNFQSPCSDLSIPDWQRALQTLPFFALEYVPDARHITDFAREQNLSQRARVELFLQACEGVSHAHGRGVIHRDLKPANILVGDDTFRARSASEGGSSASEHEGPTEPCRHEGTKGDTPSPLKGEGPPLCASVHSCLSASSVKLIDFGIARCDDPSLRPAGHTTLLTEKHSLLGTPQYMSPEQFGDDARDIDIRTDVYSLGVILYELLCGRPPHDLRYASLATAARAVCDVPPPPPSAITGRKAATKPRSDEATEGAAMLPSPSLRGSVAPSLRGSFPRVRGDLERVVLKALEKDRDQRYASAAALADDLQKWLKGDPVSVRPGTVLTRVVSWSKRHSKTATAIVTALVTAAAIGLTLVGSRLYFLEKQAKIPEKVELTRAGELYERDGGMPVAQGNKAALYSRLGTQIRTWETHVVDGIRLAKLVDRPSLFGGGQIVICGFTLDRDLPQALNGRLCAFNANGPHDKPLWSKTIEQQSLDQMQYEAWPRPAGDEGRARRYKSERFHVARAELLDIFPESEHPHLPGPEILAVHQYVGRGGTTQCAIRVYDLTGKVLFHVWADVNIGVGLFWLPKLARLVIVGLKGDMLLTEYRDSHGNPWPMLSGAGHLMVAFAIQPKLGEISRGWVHPHAPGKNGPRYPGDRWKGEWYEPLWYRAFCPAHWNELKDVMGVVETTDAGDLIQFAVSFTEHRLAGGGSYGIGVRMDADGELHMDKVQQDDASIAARSRNPNLPNPANLQLLPWSPDDINPPCDRPPEEQ